MSDYEWHWPQGTNAGFTRYFFRLNGDELTVVSREPRRIDVADMFDSSVGREQLRNALSAWLQTTPKDSVYPIDFDQFASLNTGEVAARLHPGQIAGW